MYKFLIAFLTTAMLVTLSPVAVAAESTQEARNTDMELVYHEETDLSLRSWYNEALPIGNGEMGAKIFGGVARE